METFDFVEVGDPAKRMPWLFRSAQFGWVHLVGFYCKCNLIFGGIDRPAGFSSLYIP